MLSANELTKNDLSCDGVELRLNLNPEKGCVIADKQRLAQILNNLISNALKYTEKGYVEIGYNVIDNATVQFYVKDTGVGISKEEASKIFTRFYKAKNDFTTFRGMGLGLSIAKVFIGKMGGEIHFESEKSKGSTFYFSLPYIKTECVPSEGHGNKKITDLKDKQILVAEDDDENYMLTQTILKKAGATVIRAENGKKAVQICEKNNDIDFVLMDIKMPIMDGIEATKIIKMKRSNIIIIAMSAYVFTGPRQSEISAGFDNFIPKPINVDLLISILQST